MYTLNCDRLGHQFIAQLCVEHDERAATLVSVTDKSLYAHIFKFVETRFNTRFLRVLFVYVISLSRGRW